ncbi:hypothetical protein [Francisella tularensis]|uniref:hypothetical protein n=1 Tax=Francisella tularensis TaxID=263 RepID=UPI0005A583DB|nr:hypothetical protein [Francisella tularensis]AJI63869.1 putative membrane protein [Francisella tularensis subsp. tularensis]
MININAEIPSDVYSISMKYNSGLGVIIPLVLGYFMIIIAKGIYQRKRTFWFLAVIFISLSMIGDYIQDKHIAYKITFITHALEIILLFYFRKAFNKKITRTLAFTSLLLLHSY